MIGGLQFKEFCVVGCLGLGLEGAVQPPCPSFGVEGF